MKISNSAVSGRRAPSYEEFVDREFLRFVQNEGGAFDYAKECKSIEGHSATRLKVYLMELASWDNWAPDASRIASRAQQSKWRSTATFHSFGQLPPELRADIWNYAMAPHLEAKVHCLRERNGKCISNQPANHYLRVCRESRSICLQQPVVIAFQTYFNPEIDIAYIPYLEEKTSDTRSDARSDAGSDARAVADEEEVAGGEEDDMAGAAPGIEETEITSVVGEMEGFDIEGEPGEYSDEGDTEEEDDIEENSFHRFIHSDDAKHIQTLALRKHLLCKIPLEGHISQTHVEMRDAMPNWKQTVVVFDDVSRLDQAFRNLDICFRDLSVKQKKRRAERSYARAYVKTINKMIANWDIEPMSYRWVVPDITMQLEKYRCRSLGYIPLGS